MPSRRESRTLLIQYRKAAPAAPIPDARTGVRRVGTSPLMPRSMSLEVLVSYNYGPFKVEILHKFVRPWRPKIRRCPCCAGVFLRAVTSLVWATSSETQVIVDGKNGVFAGCAVFTVDLASASASSRNEGCADDLRSRQ